MIHVDLCLPSMHRTLECFCDEQLETERFIEEVLALIGESYYGNRGDPLKNRVREYRFCLCDLTKGKILKGQRTLSQNQVYSGHKLMLL